MELDDLAFVQPLASGIWLANGPANSRFPHCNGFVLQGDRTVLIDAGIGEARIRAIDACRPIDTLIISHSHPDHILAWHALADRQLLLPAQTPDSVGDLTSLGQRFVEGRDDAAHWTRVAERLGIRPLRQPEGRFNDGDTLDLGSMQVQAIHAPGHLDDHYCFLETASGTLLSIDIDFTGFGPWYGNPEGDIERFRDSVLKLRRVPFNRICSSHKAPISRTDAPEAFDRYLAAFGRQRDLIFDLCQPSSDLAALVRRSPFYRNRMPDATLQRIFETQMIRKNLLLLVRERRIVDVDGCYYPL
jgi:glyoxylase-like metal-dependent hydrolase (beta-lactamase superfamily II)